MRIFILYIASLFARKSNLQGFTGKEMRTLIRAARRSFTVDPDLYNEELQIREVIADLEQASVTMPNEWVVFYALCDYYGRTKQYAKAVRAGERALEIRPDDPRSAFALGTTYRILARARYVDEPTFRLQPAAWPVEGLMKLFDPHASQRELYILGLSVEDALGRAIALFERALSFNLTMNERTLVEGFIASMKDDLDSVRSRKRISERPEVF